MSCHVDARDSLFSCPIEIANGIAAANQTIVAFSPNRRKPLPDVGLLLVVIDDNSNVEVIVGLVAASMFPGPPFRA